MSFETCRFCSTWQGPKVRYSTRHYAHLKCALEKQGVAFLRKLIAHPGLRWRLDDYTVPQMIAMLPEKQRTLATRDELIALLGREA